MREGRGVRRRWGGEGRKKASAVDDVNGFVLMERESSSVVVAGVLVGEETSSERVLEEGGTAEEKRLDLCRLVRRENE